MLVNSPDSSKVQIFALWSDFVWNLRKQNLRRESISPPNPCSFCHSYTVTQWGQGLHSFCSTAGTSLMGNEWLNFFCPILGHFCPLFVQIAQMGLILHRWGSWGLILPRIPPPISVLYSAVTKSFRWYVQNELLSRQNGPHLGKVGKFFFHGEWRACVFLLGMCNWLSQTYSGLYIWGALNNVRWQICMLDCGIL